MARMIEHDRGYRDGVRAAVAWLHTEAKRMNDPKAVAILNCAADGLGKALAAPTPRPEAAATAMMEEGR